MRNSAIARLGGLRAPRGFSRSLHHPRSRDVPDAEDELVRAEAGVDGSLNIRSSQLPMPTRFWELGVGRWELTRYSGFLCSTS
jgi:hypothetical protein